MILVADSGSSKTEWRLAGPGGEVVTEFTQGLNPYFADSFKIASIIQSGLIRIASEANKIEEIYFYGAGCGNESNRRIVEEGIKKIFSRSRVEVQSDMLAAARALCGKEAGIACILGTGSNSCAYDGQKIIATQISLGYILGDEGSGAVIGKKFITALCYGQLGSAVEEKFNEEFGLDSNAILDRVYRKEFPNRFLASFMPFILTNMNDKMKEIIFSSFQEFLDIHVSRQIKMGCGNTVHFTGSVAFEFRDMLEIALEQSGFRKGKILKSPMQGLMEYHLS
ncbi:MAG: ATPase [Bacteroidetes bacterium]|nr:MAG: ATPase [Bacteroidota bacterium]REK06950.1 MAG: ATPase [Bacteroidota bacterium]REK33702.1 MAG: ATPase [Bacteroidota bacterium]REK47221.1 MAG: ATPase [Bacteroidota bacterium]